MGLVCGLVQVTPEEVRRLRREPAWYPERRPLEGYSLEKVWHGLHYLLTGSADSEAVREGYSSRMYIAKRIPDVLRRGPVEHERDHAHADHRFARLRLALVIPRMAAEPQQPPERPLDHPALRQQDPALGPLRPPHDPQHVLPPLRHLAEQLAHRVG